MRQVEQQLRFTIEALRERQRYGRATTATSFCRTASMTAGSGGLSDASGLQKLLDDEGSSRA